MEKWKSAGGVVLPHTGENDKVYLVKPSNNYGPWCFPKGRVDAGETMEATALREVAEEAGLTAQILPGSSLGDYAGSYSITRYYVMRASSPPSEHDFETEEVRLLTFEDARELLSSAGNSRDVSVLNKAEKWIENNIQQSFDEAVDLYAKLVRSGKIL